MIVQLFGEVCILSKLGGKENCYRKMNKEIDSGVNWLIRDVYMYMNISWLAMEKPGNKLRNYN